MKKIKLNECQNIFYFIWDNKEETINDVNEYLKNTKGENWFCGRCLDEELKSTDILYISEINDTGRINSFYYIGEYVVDFGNYFLGLKKDNFERGDFIELWKQKQY